VDRPPGHVVPREAPRVAETRATPGEAVPFTFSGEAGEYFRIWIVNVALTVLTLGIYAAWAKVRKRRWLWGHTQFAGRSFEYTGDPLAILKGNLIFGAGAILYYLASGAEPLLAVLPVLAMWLVYPWLFQKAMRFNAFNTRHRNIRFGFRGGVGESYRINLGLALLLPITLGLIWPYLQYRQKRYQLGHLAFGSAPFRFDGAPGPFYANFARAFLLALAGGFGGIVIGVALATMLPDSPLVLMFGMALVYASAGAAFGVFYATRVSNYVADHTSLDGVATLRSSMRAREVLLLEAGNLLAIACTLGLALPWTTVRRARYRWSHLEAHVTGPIEAVLAAPAGQPGALGEVAADQLDIDISL
jgi:uncharacterized membrane protein YjgN (DUF898 family)